MADNPYFSQIKQNIISLMSDKKYKQAYELCVNILSKFPDETLFVNLKEKIEKEVEEENNSLIDQKLEESKKLMNNKKYQEALTLLVPLLKLSPNNKKLKNIIVDAQGKYKEEIDKLQTKFEQTKRKEFLELFEKDENKLTSELFFLEASNSTNIRIMNIVKEFRDKLIEKKIKEKEEMIYSDKFDAIYNFIEQLKKIDKTNKRVLDLEEMIKMRQHENQIGQKDEFVYQGENYLSTLMKLKKYDKAIKVANEILSVDKDNKKIQEILKTAENNFFNKSKEEVIDLILGNSNNTKTEYTSDKSKFTKI